MPIRGCAEGRGGHRWSCIGYYRFLKEVCRPAVTGPFPTVDTLQRRLASAEAELDEYERLLSAPDAATREDYADLTRKYARTRELVAINREMQRLAQDIEEERELLEAEEDEGLRADLRRALEHDQEALEELVRRAKLMLVPEKPEDRRTAIVEIRAGAGGEESALFVADLFRMYARYAERRGWGTKLMDSHPTSLGGYKQVVFAVEGEDAFGRLRFESGVHRVQRVPETEAQGRIHTSTATVAVLPEAEDVELELSPEELRFETYRAGGPGGQHMQKNETAVRVTHIPTGITVGCQDERSQHRNREQALRLLRARLWDLQERERAASVQEERRSQIGTGDRSEKIRTYNYPQSRVTDHRIGFTVHQLEQIMDGEMEYLIEPLLEAEVEKLLEV